MTTTDIVLFNFVKKKHKKDHSKHCTKRLVKKKISLETNPFNTFLTPGCLKSTSPLRSTTASVFKPNICIIFPSCFFTVNVTPGACSALFSLQIVAMKPNTFIIHEHNMRYFGQHTSLDKRSVHDCRSVVPVSLSTALKCWWELFFFAGISFCIAWYSYKSLKHFLLKKKQKQKTTFSAAREKHIHKITWIKLIWRNRCCFAIKFVQQAALYWCNSWQIKLQMQNAMLLVTLWRQHATKSFIKKLRIVSNSSPLWKVFTWIHAV